MLSNSGVLDDYCRARTRIFERGRAFSVPAKLGLALTTAFLAGAAAQLRLPLPTTPVPVTGQVFVVLLAGVLLGRSWGAGSMALYVGIGAAGVPWFNGFTGGPATLTGVTAGYLIGFVPAAALVGWLSHRFVRLRRPAGMVLVMIGGVGVIYLLGAVWFSVVTGSGMGTTFTAAVVPFIGWDLGKAFLAAGIGAAILPKNA